MLTPMMWGHRSTCGNSRVFPCGEKWDIISFNVVTWVCRSVTTGILRSWELLMWNLQSRFCILNYFTVRLKPSVILVSGHAWIWYDQQDCTGAPEHFTWNILKWTLRSSNGVVTATSWLYPMSWHMEAKKRTKRWDCRMLTLPRSTSYCRFGEVAN